MSQSSKKVERNASFVENDKNELTEVHYNEIAQNDAEVNVCNVDFANRWENNKGAVESKKNAEADCEFVDNFKEKRPKLNLRNVAPKSFLVSAPPRVCLKYYGRCLCENYLVETDSAVSPFEKLGLASYGCRGRMCSAPKRFHRRLRTEDFYERFDKRELA